MKIDSPKPILNKNQWYRLYHSGIFNIPKYWLLPDFLDAGYKPGKFVLRNIKRSNYEKICTNYMDMVKIIKRLGDISGFVVYEQIPTEETVIAGHFLNHIFECTSSKTLLGTADLYKWEHVAIKTILGEWYTILKDWSDIYNNHVIEFSLFSKPHGIHNERFFIWEIRKY